MGSGRRVAMGFLLVAACGARAAGPATVAKDHAPVEDELVVADQHVSDEATLIGADSSVSSVHSTLFRFDLAMAGPDAEGDLSVTAQGREGATCDLAVDLLTAERWVLDFVTADCEGHPAKLDGQLPPGRYYVRVTARGSQPTIHVRLSGRFRSPRLPPPSAPSPAQLGQGPIHLRIVALQRRGDETLLLLDRGRHDGVALGAAGVLLDRPRARIEGTTVRVLFVAAERSIAVTSAPKADLDRAIWVWLEPETGRGVTP